ncbi:MAG TPA: hypothetical protein VFZ23_14225 [Pyrinomonadaceae bacterium]
MNSEELELSLRTEFESYLKGVFAGIQQDVADFQRNFEAEFEKHKAQMDEAFRGLAARFESDPKFDQAFTESVVEHLRLARDDGAQLTAQAFNEAQKLEQSNAVSSYDCLRDAINEITGQTTQAAILKSLVDHVSSFSPRGAFFIVKHESFVCWRKFDRNGHVDDDSVRSVIFPMSADTLLADAAGSLRTKDNSTASHTEDAVYLDPLGFERPERMFAVPLVARGRGVAVLYADQDADGDPVNLEAIESLVRVAALTVELRAAAAAAAAPPAAQEAPTYVPMPTAEQPVEAASETAEPETVQHETSEPETVQHETVRAEAYSDEAAESEPVEEYTGEVAFEEAETVEPEHVEVETVEPVTAETEYFEPAVEPIETEVSYGDLEVTPAVTANDFAFASDESSNAAGGPTPEPVSEPERVEEYAYAAETKNGTNGGSYETAPEPVVEVAAAQPAKSRLSDRNVDLPIEVADDERRFHNDARRFARLLVSEIKLYNEQKVHEGRDVGDLYDRLREAIDRSREMYEKRVQPQVAAKFDYFDYELVTNLAQGNATKLGPSYPGASV